MEKESQFEGVNNGHAGEGWARLRAAYVIDRWRKQGFDTVACAPSGYCTPMNSTVSRTTLPETYRTFAIDDPSAKSALEASLLAGTTYRA